MKSKRLILIIAAALTLLFCSCSAESSALPQELRSQDGGVSISVPENWTEYEADPTESLVLAVQDGGGAFAQVFWFTEVEGKDWKAKDYADAALDYYGEAAQGQPEKITLADGNSGYYFGYTQEGSDAEGNDCVFQGYEYFIAFESGVVEVDIFYRYTDTAPTNDQLLQLRSIAETIQVK